MAQRVLRHLQDRHALRHSEGMLYTVSPEINVPTACAALDHGHRSGERAVK